MSTEKTKTDAQLFAEMEAQETAIVKQVPENTTVTTLNPEELPELAKPEELLNASLIKNTSVFANKEEFDHNQRVAKMLSTSELVPKDYQNKVANCMIAIEMATRIGASPLMVMQNLYIVHGRPAWSSQFLIATLNACGKFSPIRYEEDDITDGGRCRVVSIDKSTGECCNGVWVSMKMAEAEQWINKNGSKWKTMPQLMMRYRAAAFFTRQFAPEVSMGIMTQDEAYDVTNESKINDKWKD